MFERLKRLFCKCKACKGEGGITITDTTPEHYVPCPVCRDPHKRFRWRSREDYLWMVEQMRQVGGFGV